MPAKEQDAAATAPKKESIVGFIAVLLVFSLVAVGTGWFVSGLLQPKGTGEAAKAEMSADPKMQKKMKGKKDAGEKDAESEEDTETKLGGTFIKLEPIVVSLPNSGNSWLRLEIALKTNEKNELGEEEVKMTLGSDMVAFLRTLSIEQISGPSGFLHLKEDLLDRSRMATNGGVDEIFVMSMILE